MADFVTSSTTDVLQGAGSSAEDSMTTGSSPEPIGGETA